MDSTSEHSESGDEVQKETSRLTSFFFGAAASAMITAAFVTVLTETTRIPLYLANALLATMCVTGLAALMFWYYRGKLARRVLGVGLKDIRRIIDGLLTESGTTRFKSAFLEVVAHWSATKVRIAFLTFLFLLLGEIVLLANLAKIIEQTDVMREQTKAANAQARSAESQSTIAQQNTKLLGAQNDLIGNEGRYRNHWNLYHAKTIEIRVESLAQLYAADIHHFVGANLMRGNLRGATLHQSYLRYADFSYADLTEARLDEADLTDAYFTRATMTKTYLADADLSRAKLVRAILNETYFGKATLQGADCQYAEFQDVDLSRVTLVAADLSFATFDKKTAATLTVEKLGECAKLDYVSGLSDEVLRQLKAKSPQLMEWWSE